MPRGLARRKQSTQAFSLISLNTHNAFLHNFLLILFSHHALLAAHKPPLLISTPPFSHHHAVPKYTLFTNDFTSSPKISQNKVDLQTCVTQYTHNPPYNNRWEWTIPPKSTLFYITPKKLPPLPTSYPFHTITSTNVDLSGAWKNTQNLSEGKSFCAFIHKAEPLGISDWIKWCFCLLLGLKCLNLEKA